MTQKERQLLLRDLCARLPYGFTVHRYSDNRDITFEKNELDEFSHFLEYSEGKEFKPYLRPMSNMTEDEREELERLIDEKLNGNIDQEDNEWAPWILHDTTGIKNSIGGERFYFDEMSFVYDWLNAHRFDYRGLISLGLALEALEGMYKQ